MFANVKISIFDTYALIIIYSSIYNLQFTIYNLQIIFADLKKIMGDTYAFTIYNLQFTIYKLFLPT